MNAIPSRTKVLFLTSAYPTPEAMTSGIFVREHARAAARECDVAVVHLDRSDGIRVLRRQAAVAGEEFPTWRVRYPRRPLPLSYLGHVAAAVAGYRAARRAGFDPDVIHAHFFLAGVPAVLLGAVYRKPVVITEHWSVFLPSDPMRLGPLSRRLAKFAFERAAFVLPVSEALRDGIRAAGIEARFRIVPNAVDPLVFHPPAAPHAGRRLLTVGGLYAAKAHDVLLRAAALLAECEPEVRLDIVGDGELRAECERLAATLGISDRVAFHGERPKSEVARLMREADVFVLASRYENNPCAVLEALMSGLPVVATRVGGVPEIVNADNGLLVEPGDAPALARASGAALARDDFDRPAIARAAAARYGLEPVGDALAAVYADALAARVER